ncbi:hypothetical protein [Streptomyces uncialis]|uniref:hypothetical protein n=1 Tax=Streptomyces uncialis TaxID=1048205 RepID=UPI003792CFFE
MPSAPIVVHRPSSSDGRRVTIRDRIIGFAHSDRELIVFLEGAGLLDPETVLDDPE